MLAVVILGAAWMVTDAIAAGSCPAPDAAGRPRASRQRLIDTLAVLKADQLPRDRGSTRPVAALDAVAVAVVVAAVVAMAIWFLFFSGGGNGPGTV